jgi:hypothetical protein
MFNLQCYMMSVVLAWWAWGLSKVLRGFRVRALGYLGGSWGSLGESRGVSGAFGGVLGVSLGVLVGLEWSKVVLWGCSWSFGEGPFLGYLWASLGRAGPIVGLCWAYLGPSWGHLGPVLGPSCGLFGLSCAMLGHPGELCQDKSEIQKASFLVRTICIFQAAGGQVGTILCHF